MMNLHLLKNIGKKKQPKVSRRSRRLLATHDSGADENFIYAQDANYVVPLCGITAAHESGTQVLTRTYDTFGNILTETGSAARQLEYGFSTKPRDPATGLLYYGYRYYSSELGRWLNRDPIEEQGGINLYAFLNNDGVNQVDYLGLHSARTTWKNGGQVANCV